MNEGLEILDRFGVPVAMLVAILWGMFKAAKWVGPRIDRVLDRHECFLVDLERELEVQTDALKNIQIEQAFANERNVTSNERILETIQKQQESNADQYRASIDCMNEIKEAIARIME